MKDELFGGEIQIHHWPAGTWFQKAETIRDHGTNDFCITVWGGRRGEREPWQEGVKARKT